MNVLKIQLWLFILIVGLFVPAVKADTIEFAGGAGGFASLTTNILNPSFHQFDLVNAPISTLLINGTAVPFSGLFNITATGSTSNGSDLLFDSGSLAITNGTNTEVRSGLLGGIAGTVNGTPTFVGVLDPNTVLFADLLAGLGPLEVGVGATQFQIVVPILNLPVVGGAGPVSASAMVLATPEPSALILLATGLAGALFRRFNFSTRH